MNNVPKKHAPNSASPSVPIPSVNKPGPNGATQNPAPNANLLANYTLPGVISYLTSEFTNLERFKIITNLEKSEMKYKIQQLTSELNTVRYLNDKQAIRIRELEARLEAQGSGVESSSLHEKMENLKVSDSSVISEPSSEDSEASASANSAASEAKASQDSDPIHRFQRNNDPKQPESKDIPYIHLDAVRDARQTLNESIREIIELLRPPSSAVEAVVRPAENAYADLLESADSFLFDASPQKPQGLFERYTLKSDDILADRKASFEDEVEESKDSVDNHEGASLEESDAETVIADEVGSQP